MIGQETTPKYLLIYKELKQAISFFKYAPGTFLPPEESLTKQYDCSRTTVRRAIAMLRDEKLVEVHQGQGARVVSASTHRKSQATSTAIKVGWSYEFDDNSILFTSAPVIDKTTADLNVAQALGITLGDAVYRMQYIRTIDGTPMSYITIFLRADYVLGLDALDFRDKKFYYFLEDKFGVKFTVAHEKLTAMSAGFMESNFLRVDLGTPLLVTERVAECQLGPFEYAILKNRTDSQYLRIERQRLPRDTDLYPYNTGSTT